MEKTENPDINHVLERLKKVGFPTLGHYLDDGFCSPGIRSMGAAGIRMVGIAVTVRIPDADAVAVNHALVRLKPGEVLVLDMCGDREHAPVGAVTAAAALAQGAAGILVDGPVTDVEEIRSTADARGPLPVFARGTTCLTTKRTGSQRSEFNVPVTVDGVTVNPGDIVVGDANGVVVLAPAGADAVFDKALASDLAEPEILRRIAAGEPLEKILFLG